jgi:hypothetical protein
VSPPAGYNFAAFGGFGYVPSDGASFAPGTRTSTLVRLGWFSRESQTRELVAHELGHNFGRRHAPCGGAGSPDASFPRPDGTVGPGGHDVFGWSESALGSAPAIGEALGDIMGYCSPVWASRYTYSGVFAFRGFTPAALTGAAALRSTARATAPRQRVLMVRGLVAGGRVTLDPAVALDGVPTHDEPTGDVLVEGLDATGRVMFSRTTRLTTFDHADDVLAFAVHVPLDATTESALVELRARRAGSESRRRRVVADPADAAAPTTAGATLEVSGGNARVTCSDPTTQRVVVQDELTGQVRAIADGRSLVLRDAAVRGLRVSCSDGVRTRVVSVRR